VTSAEARVFANDAAIDAASYAKAILNILDDFGEERERQGDGQRALLNILEDIDAEKLRLEATQKAILNILDDFDIERTKVLEANAGLEAVNESMRNFVTVAAHEMRSPIAVILGFSEILTENWEGIGEAEKRKMVAATDRQSQRLSRLVDDLLTLSRIEGAALDTRPQPVVLWEAIGRCLEAIGGETASVSVSCPADLVVRVDPHHLQSILENFVQNAFKYGEPPVRIVATPADDMVEVRVLDYGPGVPPEFLTRMFGKFARADTPTTRVEKGTGLGLSIVRGLAEANGGQVSYEPNVAGGACFVVRLRSAAGQDT
jgi:signal transduction histidine kinase